MTDPIRLSLGSVLVLVGVLAWTTHLGVLFAAGFLLMGCVLLVFGAIARSGPRLRASNINMQQQMVFQRQMLMQEQTQAMQTESFSQMNSGQPPTSFR